MVIFLGDRVLSRKPEILFRIQCKIKTCLRKTCDRLIRIVNSLQNTGAIEVMYRLPDLRSVLRREDKFCLSGSRYLDLRILIHITICMAR